MYLGESLAKQIMIRVDAELVDQLRQKFPENKNLPAKSIVDVLLRKIAKECEKIG